MANLVRSAKSGSNWTTAELLAFNIEVQTVGAATFFNTPELPAATVSETILNNLDRPDGPLSKNDRHFFQYLKEAEGANSEDSSAVDDFTAFLLRMLDYDNGGRVIRIRKELSFYMAGQHVDAIPDVCLTNDHDYFLLVQGDKCTADNPEPQLIAESVAAFYQNHLRRVHAGLPLPQSQVIPGITMVGTAPSFYRTTISESLLNALVTASYPTDKTVVFRFIPPVPNQMCYTIDGMRPLGNRRVVFQCLEAFKRFIKLEHGTAYLYSDYYDFQM
ncbi:hypothetical protein JOM56_004929 [Amanita muscaria]